jgi:CPA2 family monovalent cation:H+ antiporter-2
MENIEFLKDLTILFGAAVLVSYVFRAARLSTITGFLVAGTVIGPSGLALIPSNEEVRLMEEIGVMLLLFSIGVEFSVEKLHRMRWMVLGGGGLQVATTGVVAGAAAYALSGSVQLAILLGMVTALSSTVIGLRLLHEQGQALSPQGNISLAILVFQDIAVLPMMLLLPFLRGGIAPRAVSFVSTIALSLLAIAIILTVSRAVVPRFIAKAVEARSRDIFILSVILTVVAIAWISSRFGISPGLGAFVAGLVISESEYSHQILSDVLPFRETFNSLFFVSIGMLLDPRFLIDNAGLIIGLALAVMLIKAAVTTGVVQILGFPFRVALASGLLLAQIGEFSIVLLRAAQADQVLAAGLEQLVLAVILLTMVLSPLVATMSNRLPLRTGPSSPSNTAPDVSDHTVIVGYGLNGRNVAAMLQASELNYVVLEMNPMTVRAARHQGVPIYYGDAISEVVQRTVGIQEARAIVFAISDPVATRSALAVARQLNPDAFILARTRYEAEIDPLYKAGADTVVTEEFETSLAIIRRLLDRVGMHPSKIDAAILGIRQEHYDPFRGDGPVGIPADPGVQTFETLVRKADGRSIADLGLRAQTGVTLIAVERNEELTTNPGPGFVLREGDRVFLLGSEQEVGRAMKIL